MSGELLLFIVFGAIALGGALGVVFQANPVHSALSLVATLASIAGLFLIQEAYFLSVVQIIVYTGAVVVLFLFVIMLLGVDKVDESEAKLVRSVGFTAVFLVSAVVLTGLILVTIGVRIPLGSGGELTALTDEAGGNVEAVALSLFTTYLLPFELTSVLIVSALIGGIVLAKRERTGRGAGIGRAPEVAEEIRQLSSAGSGKGGE
jgi:NADH-quinone oxidoreductase subunit J